MESNIQPRLAAQSAIPPGPLPGLHERVDQRIWRLFKKIKGGENG
jgi:hypothetical protein